MPDAPANVSAACFCATYNLCLNVCVCISLSVLHCHIHLAENDPALPDSLIVASIRKSQELLIENNSAVESTSIKGYTYTKAVTSN